MEYSGSEKQIKWAADILSPERLAELLNELDEFLKSRTTQKIEGAPRRRAIPENYMKPAQHAWLTRKLAALRDSGTLDAGTVIEYRGLINRDAEDKIQIIASAEVEGWKSLSLRHAIDRDFE